MLGPAGQWASVTTSWFKLEKQTKKWVSPPSRTDSFRRSDRAERTEPMQNLRYPMTGAQFHIGTLTQKKLRRRNLPSKDTSVNIWRDSALRFLTSDLLKLSCFFCVWACFLGHLAGKMSRFWQQTGELQMVWWTPAGPLHVDQFGRWMCGVFFFIFLLFVDLDLASANKQTQT